MSAQPVTLRWIDGDHVSGAVPCQLVGEADGVVVLYQPPGTQWMRAVGERGGPNGRSMVVDGWSGRHESVEWTGDGVVRVHRAGDPWSTWRWVDANGSWSDYLYVNVERPWRKIPIGFESSDWILDIVATTFGTWTFKDEDELEWAAQSGKYSDAQVGTIREVAASVVESIEARSWPFNADWNQWLPRDPIDLPRLTGSWNGRFAE